MNDYSLPMDSRHMVLEDSDWIRALRDATGNPELFVYKHLVEHVYVLACWDEKMDECGMDSCLELETSQLAPEDGGFMEFGILVIRCLPVDHDRREIRDMIAEKKWLENEQLEADAELRCDMIKHHQKNGDYLAALLVENGVTPVYADIHSKMEGIDELLETALGSGKTYFDVGGS